MNAAILTIGDELLNGQTIDTNAAWLGRRLNDIGITVICKLSVGDQRSDIIAGLDSAFNQSSIVLVTGGLGPTHDDITKKVLAEYFNDELVFHQDTYDRILGYFEKRGRQVTEAHRAQCFMPQKARIITNKKGTAPGMWIQDDSRVLLSMPGVPSEMKGVMEDVGLVRLRDLNTDSHVTHYIIQTAGIGETMIAERISDIVNQLPPDIALAYLPGIASVKVRLTAKGQKADWLRSALVSYGSQITSRLGTKVFGVGETTLQETVGRLAQNRGLLIGTAESCTGGSIARALTSIAGSSAYFKGSIVAYANEVKMQLLKVPKDILNHHGAVSEETVRSMVQGAIPRLGVDTAIAVSGIAGPSGGSPQKPVGTIWIAVGDRQRIVTRRLQLAKDRQLNIDYTVVASLDLLRLFLEKAI